MQSIGEIAKSPSLPKVEFHPLQLTAWNNMSLEDIPGEIWYDLADYVGYYKISNYFRFKRLLRKTIGINGAEITTQEAIQKQAIYDGYIRTTLTSTKGNTRHKSVHRLIAKTFIENPKNKPCINHMNGNRSDNSVGNIEWATYRENRLHSLKTGAQAPTRSKNKKRKGFKSIPIVLTDEQKRLAIWKPIGGFEGLYDASNIGEVRSLDRLVGGNKSMRPIKGVVLKPKMNNYGYLVVTLMKENIPTYKGIHQIVAEAFVENDNIEINDTVHHKNKIRNDNVAENLEWTTTLKNNRYAIEDGRTYANGEATAYAKLTEGAVLEIRDKCSKGEKRKDLAIKYGVSINAIHGIITRRTWKHLLVAA